MHPIYTRLFARLIRLHDLFQECFSWGSGGIGSHDPTRCRYFAQGNCNSEKFWIPRRRLALQDSQKKGSWIMTCTLLFQACMPAMLGSRALRILQVISP